MGGGPVEKSPSDFSDYCIISEVSQVRLLYSRSKVYVYRSANKRDHISGFISIIQGPDDQYYIAWTPEALLSEQDKEAYVQVELCPNFSINELQSNNADSSVAINSQEGSMLISTEPLSHARSISSVANYAFCKPVGDIASLVIHKPSLTHWYGTLIINLADGSSLAPMWFHDDESASSLLGLTRHLGCDELLVWLSHIVSIERSTSDPTRYEIRSSKSPHVALSQQTTPATSTVLSKPADASTSAAATSSSAANASASKPSDAIDAALSGNMDPLMGQVKELQWGILERFSRITQTVRDAATSFIETPVGRQMAPYIPPSLNNAGRAQSASSNLVKEYEGARIYLAKWAAQHIISQQQEDGERESQMAQISGAADRPVDGEGHLSIWEEWLTENGDLGEFEVVGTSSELPRPIRTQPPLSAERWFTFFESEASSGPNSEFRMVADADAVRRAIFAGGIEEDMRPLVWKYLLGIYSWDSSESERKATDKQKADEYWILKSKWLNDPELKESADFIEQSSRIEKDVLRTDRTLPLFATDSVFGGTDETNLSEHGLPGSSASLEKMKDILMTYHFYDQGDLGYVQGMSDLLAPVYSVYQDEPTTFWAFTKFMQRMRWHFVRDQSGMQDELDTMAQLVEIANPRLYKHLEKCDASNMFCCYRWLLIWFKREFSFENVLRLWEVLWTDYLTERFVLFVALAILQRHSDVIIDHLRSPEEVLKYVQDLSDTIDLNDALKGAEICFYKVRHRVHAVEQMYQKRNLPLFVSTTNKDKPDDERKEADVCNVSADSEVPLMSFEWEGDEQDGSLGENAPLLSEDVSGSNISRTPPLTSSLPSISENHEELPANGSAIPTSDISLPPISEAVYRIFY
ncbi:GTPase activating protein [Coemansia brasiliensis]|uniref:GTPase activating protein n=1 Tax=Coemansia brasiliensis TaxID=2650707 RepID=A0A9W8LZC4_9FUNG|nr:GTPase activating protein [Coemansia brasiliensis]